MNIKFNLMWPFAFVIMSLSLSCAAPLPVFILNPVDENVPWTMGKRFVKLSNDRIEMRLAFDRTLYDQLVFDAQFINRSSDTIMISPEKFYYCNLVIHKGEEKFAPGKIYAIDPEAQIIFADVQSAKEQADYTNSQTLQLIDAVVDLTGDIVTAGQRKTKEEIREEREEDLERQLDDVATEQEHETATYNINSLRNRWANTAVRKTSLPPNHTISGKIYFPAVKESNKLISANKVKFYFPLQDSAIVVTYKRHIY